MSQATAPAVEGGRESAASCGPCRSMQARPGVAARGHGARTGL